MTATMVRITRSVCLFSSRMSSVTGRNQSGMRTASRITHQSVTLPRNTGRANGPRRDPKPAKGVGVENGMVWGGVKHKGKMHGKRKPPGGEVMPSGAYDAYGEDRQAAET